MASEESEGRPSPREGSGAMLAALSMGFCLMAWSRPGRPSGRPSPCSLRICSFINRVGLKPRRGRGIDFCRLRLSDGLRSPPLFIGRPVRATSSSICKSSVTGALGVGKRDRYCPAHDLQLDHDLPRPPHPHHEPRPSEATRGRCATAASEIGPLESLRAGAPYTGRQLRRPGVDARSGRRPQPRRRGHVRLHTISAASTAWIPGKVWPGAASIEDVVTRLQEAERKLASATEPLAGLGASIHLLRRPPRDARQLRSPCRRHARSASMHAERSRHPERERALELAGLLQQGVNHPGIPSAPTACRPGERRARGDDDRRRPCRLRPRSLANDEDERRRRQAGVRQGIAAAPICTNLLPDDAVSMMASVTGEALPRAHRIVRRFQALTPEQIVDIAVKLKAKSTDRLRLGAIKLSIDGSIQGFFRAAALARLLQRARRTACQYAARRRSAGLYKSATAKGVLVHSHTNGDQDDGDRGWIASKNALLGLEPARAPSLLPGIASWPTRSTVPAHGLAGPARRRLFRSHPLLPGATSITETTSRPRTRVRMKERRRHRCSPAACRWPSIPTRRHREVDSAARPCSPLGAQSTVFTAASRVMSTSECLLVLAECAARSPALGAAHWSAKARAARSARSNEAAARRLRRARGRPAGDRAGKPQGRVRIWGTVQAGRLFPANGA